MNVCVSGCTQLGIHLPDCEGTSLGRDGKPAECRGCLPRPAQVGYLCQRCRGRLFSTVRTLPSLVEHLWDVGHEAMRAVNASGMGRRPAGPSAHYSPALVAADDLHACVAAWAEEVCAERDLQAPPHRGAWCTDDGIVVGLRDERATRNLVRWLDPHLEWVSSREWSAVMLEELTTLSRRARARWPMEERTRRVGLVACPGCGCLSLEIIPPLAEGSERLVRCVVEECGMVLNEDQWDRARTWAVTVARSEAGQHD